MAFFKIELQDVADDGLAFEIESDPPITATTEPTAAQMIGMLTVEFIENKLKELSSDRVNEPADGNYGVSCATHEVDEDDD